MGASGVAVPRTFGNGVLSAIANSTHPSLLLLNHTLHEDSAYGVMTHYWSTGELVNWDTVIDYYVDGVAAALAKFQPLLLQLSCHPDCHPRCARVRG